ncbi:hypothetical protein BU23DRAFT_551420 [Bimuria novae-zelandiae CBS 107.79]|uniref:Uncharacterized protein n=1 Tax=Bimuria novae-zelandiae CBS 107.79 TaxID=1447943 RepID=A0A6A5VL59_9PLEO|nr:hypothetical protein BU23DRAFT_551420 [Bimuria novae-zelandiae CBS 107.79]
MRYVFLDSNANKSLLSHFISSVRAFLSLLAVAEAEDLDYVQSKLLPHKLSLDRGLPASPACETPQATPDESLSRLQTTANAQPSDALPAIGEWQSHPAGSAPRLTTPETAHSGGLLANYTTLEDHPSPYEQAANVDTEMSDRGEDTAVVPTPSCSMSYIPTLPTSKNASDTLTTAADSNEPTNTIMDDVAETPLLGSSQAEPYTEFSSASPSQASSNWSLSPVHDSMYAWSASSPPPTCYLRDLRRLDSLYGGSSPRGLKNAGEIIELSDSFL